MSYKTKDIRNVVLLGHSGSGKTTLAETMLFEAKSISRRGSVESNSTVSDFTNIEQDKGNSIFSTLMHAKWKDSKINIIDTPGSDDFVGEVISSMKVADTALVVLNAANGVEVGTELLWEYIQNYKTPAIFVCNQMDHDKADYETTLEQARNRFGSKVLPFQFPVNSGSGFNQIVDALRMTMYVFGSDGGKPEKQEIPAEHKDRAQAMHAALVESAAENDEGLMEKFFDAGTLNESELAEGLRIGLAKHDIFPFFCCSSYLNMGSGRIMGFINDIAPSPADRSVIELEDGNILNCDASGKMVLFIYKTLSEPQVGVVSYFKVCSGTINSGDEMINQDNRTSERLNQIYIANGKIRTSETTMLAGDVGVLLKLKNSHTNNTLTEKGVELKIKKIHFPQSRIRAAIIPPSKGDMEKLMKALHQLQEEDLTLIVEQSPQLKQTILHGQGQLHLDLIKYRLEKVNGLHLEFTKPKIPYRETITKAADVSYRHKKQSGGSGQFAEVHMRIEPYFEGMPDPSDLNVRSKDEEELPWGGKLYFYWCIVGGSIDSKYNNAIKKGILQKMEDGPLTGSCCQDIRVCIYDGKMHSVDSNDMAFMIASASAFKQGFEQANPKLLEPIYNLDILCSENVMGDVMGDLQGRRSIIQGMDSEGHYQKISCKVPLAELYQYSSTLRSLSQGKAKFTRSFAEYMAVTPDIQKQIINEIRKELQPA